MKRKDFSKLTIESQNEKDTYFEHENFIAGIAPNLRGIYSTMYVQKPWTILQYAEFSTAEESNAFYRRNLATGQKDLSVAFDLATQCGYDSGHERAQDDVGKTGIAIDSVEDMKVLFNQIPLDKIAVSMAINGAILPILAFYIVAAKEQGLDKKLLEVTIQNEILKEFMVRNTNIYPPTPSIKMITDIFAYTSKNMPKFNSISISSYHMQEAGATPEIELAYTLAIGLEYLKSGIAAGMNIDSFAPCLSFSWAIGLNHFSEIAKLRAARMLWAKIVKQFNPKNQKSLTLKIHCQTNGSSLTEQDPFNNIARTTIEAMAAAFGGSQSLHTNALDKANALPTNLSTHIARNTQIYIQEETNITKTVDPWAGSDFVEKQTGEIMNKAWELLQETEELGGITKAIKLGIPKIRIEEALAKKQVRINSNQDISVGVNNHKLKEEDPLQILDVNNNTVRNSQIERLNKLKTTRNTKEVNKALTNLIECAKSGERNLLELAVEAAEKRATLGEITGALETVK